MENKQLQKESNSIISKADSFWVTNQEEYDLASEYLKSIKSHQKKIKAVFDPLAEKAHAAHKAITTQKKEFLDPVNAAEAVLKKKLIAFIEKREAAQRAEEERIRKLQEEEERQRLLKRSQVAEEFGDVEKAEEAKEAAENVVVETPVLVHEKTTVKGQSVRKNWKAQVVDKTKIPVMFMEPNMPALNDFARTTKGQSPMPGVEFYEETSLASR